MAYLSNTDDEEQQKQSQGPGNFSAFGGGAPADSGGDQSGIAKGFSSWMGTSGGAASAKAPDSSDQSQQNAKGYQQTYAGDGNQDAKQQSKPDTPPMQQGLSGSGQGTGFINFQNYESQAPSQADAISAAGAKVIGAESDNLTKAEGDSGLGGGLTPNSTAHGTGKAPPVDRNPFVGQSAGDTANTVEGLLNSGDAGVATIAAGLNPTQKSTTLGYTQGEDYARSAPELTETSLLGGQTTPSVLDYLAKSQIASGGYTQGDRMLDSALISGDAKAQAAIKGNQALDKTYQDRLTNEVPGLIQQNTDYNTNATAAVGNIDAGLTAAGNKLQGDIQAATDAYNKNPSAATLANEQATVKAYQDWYNSGAMQGGTWTQAGNGATAASAVVTPAQAQEADTIYKLQHPADTDVSHLPYPDPQHPAGTGSAASYSGSGTSPVFTPPTSIYDPGDGPLSKTNPNAAGGAGTDNLSELTAHNMTTAEKYNEIFTDPKFWGHAQTALTPPEIAALVTMHPEMAGSYPKPSPQDMAQASAMLKWMTAQTSKNPQELGGHGVQTAPLYSQAEYKLDAGARTGTKTPYEYGKSLGLSDEQMTAMGFSVPVDASA